MTNHPNHDNKNMTYPAKKSKIMKLDFSEDMEDPDEQFYKPRYVFGLSEFDMILVRMYLNLVTLMYIVMQITENMKK
jgi:hypothetical protein